MSRHLTFLAAAGLFVIGIGSACAQSIAADVGVQADTPQATIDAQADAQAQASVDDGKNADKSPVGCVKATGTNIRQRDPKTGKPLCVGPGRTYSREQIDRTGQTDLADALRRLDPSIR